jgi:hypothetical protein
MKRKSRRAWAEREARLADRALLVRRLTELGLTGVHSVFVHENRTVMASVTPRGVLRIHRGYAYAPDRVLQAVLHFTDPKSSHSDREAARRTISGFTVDRYVTPRSQRRRRRQQAGDAGVLATLRALHQELNRRYFGGRLSPIRFRLSTRMTRRLGEIAVQQSQRDPMEIAISRLHVERDGWEEVRLTVLHEMVHQWQVETGHEPDHGPAFRLKAREVGIPASAQRAVGDIVRA